jgi:4-hydroxy-tetrahydrodipicolinate reductase
VIRVAVLGAAGRMGREVCLAVEEEDGLELVGAVDPAGRGLEVSGVMIEPSITDLGSRGLDVMVDFTNSDAAAKNIRWAIENDVHSVVGSTGIPEDEIEGIGVLAESSTANVIIAPNFALGAVVMMRFAEMAANVFDQCEIIEMHRRGKRDAPSGTALMTARGVSAAMEPAPDEDADENTVSGCRGGRLGPVNIHSVRLDGMVAHQEVIFGSKGQTLTIRHDTTDRSCFMPGVIMAVKAVSGLEGLTVGLETIIGVE